MLDKYLSEDFSKFSDEINNIKKQIDKETESFKELYIKHKESISILENKVKQLVASWDKWGENDESLGKKVSKKET
jgi:archaellum component FlaC